MSNSRRPTLLPADPASITALSDRSPAFSSRNITKRHMTTNACVGCRKKRAKCDGRQPCSRCRARNEQCDYKAKASITKDELRAEVETLKSDSFNSRAVLNALLLDKHETIVQRLRSGESVDAIAQSLAADQTSDDGHNTDGPQQDQSPTPMPISPARRESRPAAYNTKGPADTGPAIEAIGKHSDADQLDRTVLPATGGDIESPGRLSSSAESPTTQSLLPSVSRLGAARRHSLNTSDITERPSALGSRTWTRVTSDRILMEHLLRLFFAWECAPFTMVSQELFLREYFEDGRHFCSPGLVNAIACVATRYLTPAQAASCGDAYQLGEQFFSEAKILAVFEAQRPTLTSIQTFALLAIREMSCGRELEAQELCLQAIRLLSALDLEDTGADGHVTDFLEARAITFTGVLTLTRATRLITTQLSPASKYSNSNLPLVMDLADRDCGYLAAQLQQRVNELRSNPHRTAKPKAAVMLSNFISDQTEYVYSFLSRLGQSSSSRTTEELPIVYQTCLQSYETIAGFMKEQDDSSPRTLFTHIYFQFCLLALFRPFIHYGADVAGVSPRTLCGEAVQAILDLTQSYASLFTLRRTPCFIPYFVFAAGLTRIALEGDSSMEFSSSPSSYKSSSPATVNTGTRSPYQPGVPDDGPDTWMTETDSQNSMSPISATNTTATTESTAASTMSAVSEDDRGLSQAVFQLEEMSVGHPAAAQAGWVLRDLHPRQGDFRGKAGP